MSRFNETIFINNTWRASQSGQTLSTTNPSTEAVLGNISAGVASDVDLAVKAAREAFDNGPWGKTTGTQRAGYLRKVAELVEKETDSLALLESSDGGKPLVEAKFDVGDFVYVCKYYADLAVELDSKQEEDVKIADARFRCIVRKEAVGVVGAVIPWNFPLLMLAWKLAPALAAGCTMVLKPSELTSLTALRIADLCVAAGLPPGVFNVVTGLGATAGAALVSHAGVDKVAFTGSVGVGSAIMQACAKDIRLVTLELGGKSPIVVFDDVDIEAVVEWVMVGIFFNQGEVCSATSRLLVHRNIKDKVIARLIAEAKKLTIGDATNEATQLGALVSQTHMERVLKYIDQGKRSGAKLVCGGARIARQGYFVEPTVFDDVPLDASIWQEEIFGPVLCVRAFDTEQEAITLANATTFGLAAAVISGDKARAARVARAFRAGIVWVNCSQPTFSEAPWGGYKRSGIGRELGIWGLNNYLQVKQISEYTASEPWAYYIKGAGAKL